MTRRALPASEWREVRKDATKATTTSDAVADSGKAPPAHIGDRPYPGQRTKMPPIDDTADTSEEITLPRKAGCKCEDVAKCACQATKTDDVLPVVEGKADQPVQKPLPKPSSGESKDSFVSSCMADPKMNQEYPDEKQRAAICYSQAGEHKEKAKEREAKALPEDQNAAGDDGPGVMLALWTPNDLANKIKQPGGVDPKDMHATLGYYGKVGKDVHPDHVEAITKCVAMSAEGYKPVKAHIGGVGRFNGTHTSDNKDVLIAHVDSPGLHEVRDHLIEHVHKCAGMAKADESGDPGVGGPPTAEGNGGAAARAEMAGIKPTHGHGLKPKQDHGYTPHITLAYIDPKADMPLHKLERHEFTFTHLVMAVGDKRHVFPLGQKAGVAKSIWMPIIKADDDQRLATGIVLQPEIVDAQGDIISADVIRQAAHNFLALYNKKTQLGLQHELMKPEGVELVESWIAPVDMILNNRDVRAGTWMMTVRVKNDVLWTKIKTGQLGGFSIGGVAKVQRLPI